MALTEPHFSPGLMNLVHGEEPSIQQDDTSGEPTEEEHQQGDRPKALVGTASGMGRQVWFDPDLPAERLPNEHMAITGESGSGKTQAMKTIMADLHDRGIPALVLDFKDDYAEPKYAATEGFKVYDPTRSPLPMNPLQPSADPQNGEVNINFHTYQLVEILGRIYSMGELQQFALREAIKDVYRDANIPMSPFTPHADQQWPSLESVKAKLAAAKGNAELLGHMAPIFDFGFFSNTDSRGFDEIASANTVIRLGQLPGNEVKNTVAEFFLMGLYNYLIRLPQVHDLREILVLDEAWRVVNSPFLEPLMREGRAFGLGIFVATQFPTDLPLVVSGSAATQLFFSQSDPQQVAEIQKIVEGHTNTPDADRLGEVVRGLLPLTAVLHNKQYAPYVKVEARPYFARYHEAKTASGNPGYPNIDPHDVYVWDKCKHCGDDIYYFTGIDDNVPWVHADTRNAFCQHALGDFETCDQCNGTSRQRFDPSKPCSFCGATGITRYWYQADTEAEPRGEDSLPERKKFARTEKTAEAKGRYRARPKIDLPEQPVRGSYLWCSNCSGDGCDLCKESGLYLVGGEGRLPGDVPHGIWDTRHKRWVNKYGGPDTMDDPYVAVNKGVAQMRIRDIRDRERMFPEQYAHVAARKGINHEIEPDGDADTYIDFEDAMPNTWGEGEQCGNEEYNYGCGGTGKNNEPDTVDPGPYSPKVQKQIDEHRARWAKVAKEAWEPGRYKDYAAKGHPIHITFDGNDKAITSYYATEHGLVISGAPKDQDVVLRTSKGPCYRCAGKGFVDESDEQRWHHDNLDYLGGKYGIKVDDLKGDLKGYSQCYGCKGTGEAEGEICRPCKGSGLVPPGAGIDYSEVAKRLNRKGFDTYDSDTRFEVYKDEQVREAHVDEEEDKGLPQASGKLETSTSDWDTTEYEGQMTPKGGLNLKKHLKLMHPGDAKLAEDAKSGYHYHYDEGTPQHEHCHECDKPVDESIDSGMCGKCATEDSEAKPICAEHGSKLWDWNSIPRRCDKAEDFSAANWTSRKKTVTCGMCDATGKNFQGGICKVCKGSGIYMPSDYAESYQLGCYFPEDGHEAKTQKKPQKSGKENFNLSKTSASFICTRCQGTTRNKSHVCNACVAQVELPLETVDSNTAPAAERAADVVGDPKNYPWQDTQSVMGWNKRSEMIKFPPGEEEEGPFAPFSMSEWQMVKGPKRPGDRTGGARLPLASKAASSQEWDKCDNCGGTGRDARYPSKTCLHCRGSGVGPSCPDCGTPVGNQHDADCPRIPSSHAYNCPYRHSGECTCPRSEVWNGKVWCPDKACREQGCPEHRFHNYGDHTYEQHHDPEEHVGPGPCRCPVYA